MNTMLSFDILLKMLLIGLLGFINLGERFSFNGFMSKLNRFIFYKINSDWIFATT